MTKAGKTQIVGLLILTVCGLFSFLFWLTSGSQLSEQDKKESDLLVAKAVRLQDEGKYDDAISAADSAIAKNPRHGMAFFLRGNARWKKLYKARLNDPDGYE